jgi:very-short-patch-repair endonuclease
MKKAVQTETVSSLLEWRLAELLEVVEDQFRIDAEEDANLVASPIEAVMLSHLRYLRTGYSGGFQPHSVVKNTPWEQALQDARYMADLQVAIYPQCSIEPYRVDFLIVVAIGNSRKWIVVECDGHDFHEKTKAQAAHDKKRDRFLQSKGLSVFRFTGAEIWKRNPELLADITASIFDFVEAHLLGRAHG